eukprot:344342-Prorocentrum_lima.AAC.1
MLTTSTKLCERAIARIFKGVRNALLGQGGDQGGNQRPAPPPVHRRRGPKGPEPKDKRSTPYGTADR